MKPIPLHSKEARASTQGRLVVAVWGDGVVARALALLLRDAGYAARFLLATSSSLLRSASLEGTGLLLLTPTPGLSTEDRRALLASLREAAEAAAMPVLELVSSSEEEPPEGGARDESWHYEVPWPCKTDELERRIALLADAPKYGLKYGLAT